VASSIGQAEWVHVPVQPGWYWHRFKVYGIPIYNVCCVVLEGTNVLVHYLGEREPQLFKRNPHDKFCGPLTPPQ
jgi:hypothetical protein